MSESYNFEALKEVIMDLLKTEQRDLAFKLIDVFYPHARTLGDYDALGYTALKSEYRDVYLKCAENAYSIAETSEQKFIARSNLYKAYNALNQPDRALFYVDLNLSLAPDDFETQTQKSFNLSLAGKKDEGEKILLDLVEKFPEKKKDLRNALSGKMLRDGRLAEGVLAFIEAIKTKSHLFHTVLKMRKWEGTVVPGTTIYVEGEGGIGDEIINIRFFKHLEELGMKPILYSSWSKYRVDLVDLFRRHGYDVICEHYSIDNSQMWTNMMSLPGYLNLKESDLWTGPYLTPQRQEKNQLPKTNKLRVGIKCSGNPYFSQDEYRKIPIDVMLAYIPDECEVYYIDRDVKTHPRVTNLSDRIESWEDTLDFIDQMDIIVSSCTSLVHASGAMGKATAVIVPIAEYYIWSTSRRDTTSPWYGENFSVYKQTKIRSWHEPLAQVQNQLYNLIKGQ